VSGAPYIRENACAGRGHAREGDINFLTYKIAKETIETIETLKTYKIQGLEANSLQNGIY
jgi:hypothetical protein